LATVPLIAILAGRGAASGWDAETSAGLRRPLQTVAAVLSVWTLFVAMNAWKGWFIFDERAPAQFVVGLLQFGFGVHHDRPVPGDRFLERLA
jgi:hypothetical protein